MSTQVLIFKVSLNLNSQLRSLKLMHAHPVYNYNWNAFFLPYLILFLMWRILKNFKLALFVKHSYDKAIETSELFDRSDLNVTSPYNSNQLSCK